MENVLSLESRIAEYALAGPLCFLQLSPIFAAVLQVGDHGASTTFFYIQDVTSLTE
jgi:hypothetical protein